MMNMLYKLREQFSKEKKTTPSREQLEEVAHGYCIAHRNGLDAGSLVILGDEITITISFSNNKRKRRL